MKRMGTAIALACTVALAGTLAGCGGGGESGGVDTSNAPYTLKYKEAFIASDYDGDKLLIVNLDMTGNNPEGNSLSEPALDATAELDGEKLTDGYLSDDHPEYIDTYGDNIDKGETETTQLIYELPSNEPEGTVTLIIEPFDLDFEGNVTVLEQEIKLDELEMRVTESDFDVQVTGGGVTTDIDDNPALLINLTFTNNSEKTTSYSDAIGEKFFQNGTELETTITGYGNPDVDDALMSNDWVDVQPGASIEVQIAVALHDSENPVDCTFFDRESPDMSVITEGTMSLSGEMEEGAAATDDTTEA